MRVPVIRIPYGYMRGEMDETDRRATEASVAFGKAVRKRREAASLSQSDVSLATGVGRRFVMDMEKGKSTCELGRSLLVAKSLGLGIDEVLGMGAPSDDGGSHSLPDMEDEDDEPVPHGLL